MKERKNQITMNKDNVQASNLSDLPVDAAQQDEVKGGLRTEGHKESIEIVSWSFGASNPTS